MPKSNVPERPSIPRAVVDTNLLVRGLLKGPVTIPLMQAWKEQCFQLVTSEVLLAELFEVLARPKFERYFTLEDVRELGELIYELAEVVEPTVHARLCRDPKDDIFLDVAIAGSVAYLVTGDDDLKDDQTLKAKMRDQYGVQIMGVPEFLAVLASIQ
ncbi:MAG: putative toxin-antitoxin system toxin component, PIN family [Ardenticatenaceae bacterium]|nr:putative toxin-antitoxin system toxin component, PIN family [Ardenticatenaceae bacterium]